MPKGRDKKGRFIKGSGLAKSMGKKGLKCACAKKRKAVKKRTGRTKQLSMEV